MTAAHDVLRSDVVRIRDDIENNVLLRHDSIVLRLNSALTRDEENTVNERSFTDEEQQAIRRVLNGVPGMAFALAGTPDDLEDLLGQVRLMGQFLQGKFDYIAQLEHKVDGYESDWAAVRRIFGVTPI